VEQRRAVGNMNEHQELSDLVRSLIGMMQSGNIARLDIEHGDLRLSLRSHNGEIVAQPAATQRGAPAATTATVTQDHEGEETYVVRAPMIGTFYVASAPGEPPFVQPGDRVEAGQTIGIIEAMKIMNEIAADRSGVVVEVVAANGEPVEFGSMLIRLAPDAESN
jgi:acetyl-CoA carboxylase biotin carboxyl carrier protein